MAYPANFIAVDQGNTHTRIAVYDPAALMRLEPGQLPESRTTWSLKTELLDAFVLDPIATAINDPLATWWIASV
ncbi:MAG TPA: hypothetical protein VIY86_00815, partial [Pirellulaceae bacterium]